MRHLQKSPIAPTVLRQAGGKMLPVSVHTTFTAILNYAPLQFKPSLSKICTKTFSFPGKTLSRFVSSIKKCLLKSLSQLVLLIQKIWMTLGRRSLIDSKTHWVKISVQKFLEKLCTNICNPIQISIARLIPLHMKWAATQVITDLLDKQVITKVNKPTQWCEPGFLVPKPKETSVRLVMDYTKLNIFVKRPIHNFPFANVIIQFIPETAKWFAKLYVVYVYFQLALDEDSSFLNHISHSIRSLSKSRSTNVSLFLLWEMVQLLWFCHWRLWICQEDHQCYSNLATNNWGIGNSHCMCFAKVCWHQCHHFNQEVYKRERHFFCRLPHFWQMHQTRSSKNDISIFTFPKNITNLWSFLGLANQLVFILPDFSHVTSELRKLLSVKNGFLWLDIHEKEFQKLKSILTSDQSSSKITILSRSLLVAFVPSIKCKTDTPQLGSNFSKSSMASQNADSIWRVYLPLK